MGETSHTDRAKTREGDPPRPPGGAGGPRAADLPRAARGAPSGLGAARPTVIRLIRPPGRHMTPRRCPSRTRPLLTHRPLGARPPPYVSSVTPPADLSPRRASRPSFATLLGVFRRTGPPARVSLPPTPDGGHRLTLTRVGPPYLSPPPRVRSVADSGSPGGEAGGRSGRCGGVHPTRAGTRPSPAPPLFAAALGV